METIAFTLLQSPGEGEFEFTGSYIFEDGVLKIWEGVEESAGRPNHIFPLTMIRRGWNPLGNPQPEPYPAAQRKVTVYALNVAVPNNPYGFGSLYIEGRILIRYDVLWIWNGPESVNAARPADLWYPLHQVMRIDNGDTRPSEGPWA